MAQLKRLTRRQKVLHTAMIKGYKPRATTPPVDLAALEAHGLIRLNNDGKWETINGQED